MIGFVLIRDAKSYVVTNLVGPLCRAATGVFFENIGCGRRCRPRHGVAWGRHVVLVCLARARFGGSAFSFVGRPRSVGSRRRWASDSLDASSGSLVHPGSSKLKWLRAKGPAGGRACLDRRGGLRRLVTTFRAKHPPVAALFGGRVAEGASSRGASFGRKSATRRFPSG